MSVFGGPKPDPDSTTVAALLALHRRAAEYRLYVKRMNGLEDLMRLRAFVRIVECGSISAAVRTLNTTQPTLSRQLRQLERDLMTEVAS